MNTTHQSEIFVETSPAKRLMTPRKDLALAIVVAIPQLVLLLAYHRGSKQDLLAVAMFAGLLASCLAFFLREVALRYEVAQRLHKHFRHRAEMLYIDTRGFAFTHGFVLDEELEVFLRGLLPSEEEARAYHSGLYRGLMEAKNPETYRVARAEAAAGTRFYLAGRGLANRVVGVTPRLSNQGPEGAA